MPFPSVQARIKPPAGGGTAAITAVYDRNAYMRRAALDAWAALLQEIVEDKERPDNVVQIVR